MSMLEYVLQFDQLLRYAPDMVQIETSKVWRFLSGLRPGLTGLVDTGRDGPESYGDAVRHAIRQESWMKIEKNVNLSAGEGMQGTVQSSPLQVYVNQQSGIRLGFQSRKPNNQDKIGGSGGKSQTGGKRKNGPRN